LFSQKLKNTCFMKGYLWHHFKLSSHSSEDSGSWSEIFLTTSFETISASLCTHAEVTSTCKHFEGPAVLFVVHGSAESTEYRNKKTHKMERNLPLTSLICYSLASHIASVFSAAFVWLIHKNMNKENYRYICQWKLWHNSITGVTSLPLTFFTNSTSMIRSEK
jgi:hypothetical protein